MGNASNMTLQHLRAFDNAWAQKDVATLMQFMTDDCEYHASIGPDPGERFVGREEVRRGFQTMLTRTEGTTTLPTKLYFCGDIGIAEWAYSHVNSSNETIIIRGCDLFEFAGSKIKVKNAFRKCQL